MDFTKSWKTLTLAIVVLALSYHGEYYEVFDPGAGVFEKAVMFCMGSYAVTSAARKIRDGMAAKTKLE